jgi:hypothetical protein
MREDWVTLAKAAGFDTFTDPDVIIARVKALSSYDDYHIRLGQAHSKGGLSGVVAMHLHTGDDMKPEHLNIALEGALDRIAFALQDNKTRLNDIDEVKRLIVLLTDRERGFATDRRIAVFLKVPACCEGCEWEWGEALRIIECTLGVKV